jgi:hypothetical protein
MKPLDNYEIWTSRLNEADVFEIGSDFEVNKIYLKEFLEAPIHRFTPVLSWYIRSKWVDAFKMIKNNAPIEVLELASGSSVFIPQVIAKHYSNPQTKYTTFNLNKKLTAGFKAQTKNLPLKIDVVEDAAQNIGNYIGQNKVDAVVFEHAINDILQGMFAERYGIDTIDTDWFEILPEMIKIISTEYSKGTFETSVKNEFLALLDSCLNVLKPNGFMTFFQFMYQADLDLGYDAELYGNMVDIIRKWVHEAGIGKEVFFDGFEPHWWMFIQKV